MLSNAYICTNAQRFCFFRLLSPIDIVPGIEEPGIEATLRYTREAIWSYTIGHCPSYRKKNRSSQFSEIFLSVLFETLTAYEKLLSQTSCVHRGTCWCCNIHINREEKAIVKIFLASEIFRYHQLRIDQKLCPHLIESETRQSRTIQCFNCSTSFTKYCIAM